MPHEERTTSLAAPPKMLTTLEKPISLRPEQICNEPTTLRLKQHSSLLSSGGYTITTPNTTETLYSATGPSKKWHSTRTITSATDLPLYDLRCDARFRWTIALPGQADEDAVATFTRRKSPNGDTLVLRFEASETGEEVTLVVRGKTSLIRAGEECVSSKDASVYWGDRLVVQTNIVDGKTARVPFKANEWDVSVAGGFDGSLVSLGRFSLVWRWVLMMN